MSQHCKHPKRLLKLADLLEADATNKKGIKFDLGGWGSARKKKRTVDMSCGTTACAMGLAVLSGEFEKYGLFNVRDDNTICPAMKTGEVGFGAATALFGISNVHAEWLFYAGYYLPEEWTKSRGERTVAKRIRDFVAGNFPSDVEIVSSRWYRLGGSAV